MQFNQILLLLSCVGFLGVVSGLKEGDKCEFKDNSRGVCQLYSKCIDKLKSSGQGTKFCGYAAKEAIICCVDDQESGIGSRSSERISVEKCNGYKQIVTAKTSILKLSLIPQTASIENAKCDYSVKLIIGGEKAKAGEFPHMAALGWRVDGVREYDFNCGGSLISENFVLTAAHCATDDENIAPVVVRLGDQNLIRNDDGAQPITVDIEKFIKHDQYKPVETRYYDIALVKLKQSVSFNKFVRPACLWQTQHINDTHGIATGFGVTAALGDKSDELLKVSLDIYDNTQCQSAYTRNRKLPEGIIDSQMCSGVLEGGKDTCQGDSGGPLQLSFIENQCAFYVVGVTSFGQFCGGANAPGVYTRVSSFLDWIEGIVWE